MSFRASAVWRVVGFVVSITILAGCSANSGPAAVAARPPALAPVINMQIVPASIKQGQSAVVTWTTQGAKTCLAQGAWSGELALANSTGFTIGPIQDPGTYTYTVQCSGDGGISAKSQVLMVGAVAAPTLQLNLSSSAVATGGSIVITWSSTNTNACTASGGAGTDHWSGSQPTDNPAGFNTGGLSTPGEYAYVLSCLGSGGSTSQSAIVSVSASRPPSPPTFTLSVQPAVVAPGQSTALSWSAAGATSCVAGGGSGADSWIGTQPIASSGVAIGPLNSAGTYSYTLTCSGAGGSTAHSVSVAVATSGRAPPPSVTLDVAPTVLVAGGAATLTWTSANADSCGAAGSWSGNQPLSGNAVSTGTLTVPGAYFYTLTCSGVGGSNGATTSLTVRPTAAAVTRFAANPTTIQSGQSSSLTWTSSDATSCVAGGGSGSDNWVGPMSTSSSGFVVGPLTSTGTTVYSLVCTGPGGTGTPMSASVVVGALMPTPANVTNFAVSPSTITTGQSALLMWQSRDASYCTATGGTGSDGWTGSVGTASHGTSTGPITAAATYVYTLTCAGPGGAGASSSVVVNVVAVPGPEPVITSFSATPSTIAVGQSATLAWVTTAATSCTGTGGTGSDGWQGSVPVSASSFSTGNIPTAGSYTYTLTCTNSAGVSAPNSLVLNVTSTPASPASVDGLSASPNTVIAGQSTSLAWSSSNATSCNATGGSGSDAWNGSVGVASTGLAIGPLSTIGTYAYTLTCTGAGGSSAPRSVTVNVSATPAAPLISTFTVSPSAVQSGGLTSLAWSSSNAASCSASGGTGADGWNGTQPAVSSGTSVGPIVGSGSVTYSLICSGAGGSSIPSSVSVNVTATAPAATVSNFRATPSAMQTGHATILSWAASNATACTATGGTGSDGWGGAIPPLNSSFSTGVIATAGVYTYTLTCTGPGGDSAPSAATLTVTDAPPVAAVATFTAIPATVIVGQSTQLAWTTSGASACTASGGSGADGWGGSQPSSSAGTSVGPLNVAATYVYTLTCTGPGGASAPASLTVTVNNAPVAAAIVAFAVTPTTLTAGQSATLSWSTTAATSCAASGGTGSDGWTGSQAPTGGALPVGPFTVAGTVTFTLTCQGSGGVSPPRSTTLTVNAAVPSQPTVTLLANGVNSAQVNPGSSAVFSWTSANATSCSATGGSGNDGWSGSKPVSSNSLSIGPLATPGIYAYTLTCYGVGGSGSSTVTVAVIPANNTDCGLTLPSTKLVAPAATVSGSILGLCLFCSVDNAVNLISSANGVYATMSLPVGVIGSTSLRVTDATATFPAGRKVGFILSQGNSILSSSVLQGVKIQTLMGNTVQETATGSSLLTLQALGILSIDPYAGFAGFTATKPFNSVAVTAGAVASLLNTYKVYEACVTLR